MDTYIVIYNIVKNITKIEGDREVEGGTKKLEGQWAIFIVEVALESGPSDERCWLWKGQKGWL